MRADLSKLKLLIRPSTDEQARASMQRYETSEPNSPGYVMGLESELQVEYLTCVLGQELAQSPVLPRSQHELSA
jgi:hypothetical protein